MFLPFLPRSRQSLAIDLGNNNTLVANKENIITYQPSWIAFNQGKKSVKAVGTRAWEIEGKNTPLVETVKPLRGGVIADHNSARIMVNEIIKTALPNHRPWSGFERVISGVPLNTTHVERMSFLEALEQFPTGKRQLIPEPIAAAVGMGLNIHGPKAKLIMDIGGGITEIVVICSGGIVNNTSLRIAGDAMDEALRDYYRKCHNLAIGLKTAERVKIAGCTAVVNRNSATLHVQGKDMMTGLPKQLATSGWEVMHALEPVIGRLELLLLKTLADCPPEFAGDLIESGIFLTGGGSLLGGLAERLMLKTGLKVHTDQNPFRFVGNGIQQVMRDPQRYQTLMIS